MTDQKNQQSVKTDSELFNIVMECIKDWDIRTPEESYRGYNNPNEGGRSNTNKAEDICKAIQLAIENRPEYDYTNLRKLLELGLKIKLTQKQMQTLDWIDAGLTVSIHDVTNSNVRRFRKDKLWEDTPLGNVAITTGNIISDVEHFMKYVLPQLIQDSVMQNFADDLNIFLQKRKWPQEEIEIALDKTLESYIAAASTPAIVKNRGASKTESKETGGASNTIESILEKPVDFPGRKVSDTLDDNDRVWLSSTEKEGLKEEMKCDHGLDFGTPCAACMGKLDVQNGE